MPSARLNPPRETADAVVSGGMSTDAAAGRGLPWPVPALLAWAAGWLTWAGVLMAGSGPTWAALAGALAGVLVAWSCVGAWRRLLAAGGFPLSALALGASGPASLPAWGWLMLAAPLLLIYPLRVWRDAPFFPTPTSALAGLDQIVDLAGAADARLLDAGCGIGHGLAALRALWPSAQLHGVEWSALLCWLAARRCRWAVLRRADIWHADWSPYALVYLFQRPESMARAWAKAQAELAPGSWLVSLEFAVPGVAPVACLQGDGRRPVWVYRTAAVRAGKDNSTSPAAGR